MQWWTDFLDWLNSDNGWRILSTAVIPFVAIVVAGIVAAGIGRASARKVIELSEREVRASAVTALISAARKAAVWNTLPAPEQQHIDHLIGDSEIRLRLLPIAGTALAADWSRHEIAGMKRNAISFSFQAEQSLLVFRDRLIEWQARPSRAKKLFKNDLDSWAYDSSDSEQELVHQQQKWAAQQVTETGPITTITTTPFTRPPSPTPIQAPLVESTAALAAGVTVASLAAAGVASANVASGSLAAELATAAAPAAETVATEVAPPEASLPAGDQPHPLVEPVDTSSHDVSEASMFGGNSPQETVDSEHTEPEYAAQETSEADRSEPNLADAESSKSEIVKDGIVDGGTVEGGTVEPVANHEAPSDDAGTSEDDNHDGHEHHVENHDHDHDEHQHDERQHDEHQHDEHQHDEHQHDERQHDEWRG
jgi:hypothetical protein